ncbi:complexin-2 isoform X3 [Canis lupus familiaris]|uniref:complexin-2 isoform X3 n=1 Tax=Canis lupus familiaris TaxID=9615 RepID=UPI0018F377CC|nr:complexin-2 isoform X3 [Canis lupus familiaris]
MGSPPPPPSPCRFHCWRPLSSPSLAPASYLRKLGSPWERVCPWGRPLGFAPCGSADTRGGPRRGWAPPASTCASSGGRQRLGGGVRRRGRRRAPEPRSRAPGSAAEELQPPTGSCTFLACHLLCSLTEGSYISAQPRSKVSKAIVSANVHSARRQSRSHSHAHFADKKREE